jgi:4-hydroxy-2-oxoheptanedioate aldolase
MPVLRKNSLKAKLSRQDFVLGTFLEIPSPQLVEILGLAGFDFVIIDREHGSIDLAQTEGLIRACLSTDISPMVRVAQCDPVLIRQPLDMGAVGVHVPQVASVESAALAVRSSRFHPCGERGIQPFVRAASYRAHPTAEYLAQTAEDTAMVFHIEGKQGIEAVDGILALEGTDVVFIGPYDLSQSLGMPGEVEHPLVREAMVEVVEKSKRAGKCVGTFCDDIASASRWRSLGVRYLAVSIDAAIFLRGAEAIVRGLRGER